LPQVSTLIVKAALTKRRGNVPLMALFLQRIIQPSTRI
jgi:hypothetical protein